MQEEGRARRVGTVLGIVIAAGLLSLLGYSVVGQGQTREMTIASWAEYLEGSIVRDFERESKVKVNLTYYNDNEELLAKMQTGHPGYDLVVPTGYMVEIMRKEGLLRQFTPEEIPNARHLDPRFRRLFYDPSGAYYVPYAYGVSGIGYNSDVLKGPVESWLALWDERRRGRILMLDDMMEVFDVGCRVLGYRLNDRNPRQLKEALELLRRQKPLLRKYENTLTKELLAAGEVDIAHTWSGTLLKLALEHPQFKFVVPKEGVLLFVDNLCIPKDAPNPDLAQRFVDFLLQPEMSARNIRTILYAMPNPEAQALLDKGLRENPMLFPPVEDLSRYDITRDLGEYMAEIQRSWTELKSE
jgi:spermidine/putrescine transport system substrate-binding protein